MKKVGIIFCLFVSSLQLDANKDREQKRLVDRFAPDLQSRARQNGQQAFFIARVVKESGYQAEFITQSLIQQVADQYKTDITFFNSYLGALESQRSRIRRLYDKGEVPFWKYGLYVYKSNGEIARIKRSLGVCAGLHKQLCSWVDKNFASIFENALSEDYDIW